MPINKFTTLLDLSRQAKIITGETATFDGKILAGIPFSGYPTGVNTATTVSLGVVSTESAVFSGNTGTTVFDVSNPLSPYYNPLFSGYTAFTWTNPLFSATTSGLTLPITILSADTQVVGPFWTLTQTGYTGDYIIGTVYTGYSVTYSFFSVSQFSPGVFSGVTSASQQNFSAGTLDYKGPLDYLSSKENISVDGRLITNKITITNGASSATTNYVLSQIDDTGKGGWSPVTSLLSGSCLPIVNLETINDCSSGITFNSDVTINGDVIVNGSATTINTEIIRSKDNNIILNYSGTHLTAIGGGFTLEDGVSNGVDSRIYSDPNGVWLFDPSLSANSGTIINFSADTIGSSGDCVNDLYVSNIHSCSPLNINPLNEGDVYFGSTSGVTIDVTNSRIGIGTKTPTERLTVSGTSFFKTSSLTTGTSPSFYYLDGVSTPTDTSTIKSIYKEFRPTTTSSSNVVGDGTLLYPNITSPTNGEFYSKANLILYTGDLSLLNSNEALTSEINVVQIQTNTGTYNDIVKSSSSVLRNLTAGGTINEYVGFWMNGFDITLTHNGSTNNIYGFYMDDQSTRSGNIPPPTNRWGIYIKDAGYNYIAGYLGIGTTTPSEKLDVSGKTKTTTLQVTSGATNGYVLVSDSIGNAIWQSASGATSGVTFWSASTGVDAIVVKNSGSVASGLLSLAQGYQTSATTDYSHAEGQGTLASGISSHAEGKYTIASGDASHSEGVVTTASGQGSHSEGYQTSATTQYSHAEGFGTLASGDYSHAEGNGTLSLGTGSHAEGLATSATTDYSHAEGGNTLASGGYSHAEGIQTISSGIGSHAEGIQTISSGIYSHAEGQITSASGQYSHAEGSGTTASGQWSHAEGFGSNSIGGYSHAEGGLLFPYTAKTTSIGVGSHAEGFSTTASTAGSHSEGWGTIAYENYQHVSGRWNNTTNASQLFIIGKGSSNAARSNAFRVNNSGQVYGAGAVYSSGADYAEYFESLSGDSIPYGTVVELVDDKIKVCVDANNAVGVISSNPTLIGNNEGGTADEWVGKYEKDEWGRYIMEDYSYDVIDYMTESGETIYKTITEQTPKLSQDFDPNMIYIPRSERPEWNVVGLVGQVRILKNQQIPSRWIKMKDINNDIDLYLIR